MLKIRRQQLQGILITLLLLPLLAHMINGQFVRMLADDYCFTDIAVHKGWWGAMVYQYTQWSGTFSSTAIQAGVALLGATALRWLPMLLLVVWVAGMIWAVYELSKLTGIQSPIFVALFLGTLIVFATVDGASNIFQSLYWRSGSATYVTPLALMSVFAGWILHILRCRPKRAAAPEILGSIILPFVIGGTSPLVAPLQVAMILVAMVAIWRLIPSTVNRPALSMLLVALVSAFMALIILVVAPGNAVRQAEFNTRLSFPMIGLLTLGSVASFISTSLVIFSPVGILIALIFPGLIAYALQPLESSRQFFIRKNGLRLLLLTAGIGLGLLVVTFGIAAYSISDIPPARAMIVPQFILVMLAVTWGIIMGLSLQRGAPRLTRLPRIAVIILAMLLIMGPIRSTISTVLLMPKFNTFANEWDTRDNQIHEAIAKGTRDVTLPPFSVDLATYAGIKTLDSQAHADFNSCAESYYGLTSLAIKSS